MKFIKIVVALSIAVGVVAVNSENEESSSERGSSPSFSCDDCLSETSSEVEDTLKTECFGFGMNNGEYPLFHKNSKCKFVKTIDLADPALKNAKKIFFIREKTSNIAPWVLRVIDPLYAYDIPFLINSGEFPNNIFVEVFIMQNERIKKPRNLSLLKWLSKKILENNLNIAEVHSKMKSLVSLMLYSILQNSHNEIGSSILCEIVENNVISTEKFCELGLNPDIPYMMTCSLASENLCYLNDLKTEVGYEKSILDEMEFNQSVTPEVTDSINTANEKILEEIEKSIYTDDLPYKTCLEEVAASDTRIIETLFWSLIDQKKIKDSDSIKQTLSLRLERIKKALLRTDIYFTDVDYTSVQFEKLIKSSKREIVDLAFNVKSRWMIHPRYPRQIQRAIKRKFSTVVEAIFDRRILIYKDICYRHMNTLIKREEVDLQEERSISYSIEILLNLCDMTFSYLVDSINEIIKIVGPEKFQINEYKITPGIFYTIYNMLNLISTMDWLSYNISKHKEIWLNPIYLEFNFQNGETSPKTSIVYWEKQNLIKKEIENTPENLLKFFSSKSLNESSFSPMQNKKTIS